MKISSKGTKQQTQKNQRRARLHTHALGVSCLSEIKNKQAAERHLNSPEIIKRSEAQKQADVVKNGRTANVAQEGKRSAKREG